MRRVEVVRRDYEIGRTPGVTSTPTFLGPLARVIGMRYQEMAVDRE